MLRRIQILTDFMEHQLTLNINTAGYIKLLTFIPHIHASTCMFQNHMDKEIYLIDMSINIFLTYFKHGILIEALVVKHHRLSSCPCVYQGLLTNEVIKNITHCFHTDLISFKITQKE